MSNNPIKDQFDEVVEENTDIDTYIDSLKISDPVRGLRLKIFEFFKHKLESIEQKSMLRESVEQSLLADLQNGKLTATQKISLLNDLSHKDILATDSVLRIFEPKPNAPYLLDANVDQQFKDRENDFGNLKKEDTEALQSLGMFVQALEKAKKEKTDNVEAEHEVVEDSVDDLSDIE